jgi:hypothetical protein
MCFSTITVSFLGSLLSATMCNKQAVYGDFIEVTLRQHFDGLFHAHFFVFLGCTSYRIQHKIRS